MKQIAMVFIQWGIGFIVFGLATVLIGLIILKNGGSYDPPF